MIIFKPILILLNIFSLLLRSDSKKSRESIEVLSSLCFDGSGFLNHFNAAVRFADDNFVRIHKNPVFDNAGDL